MRKGKPKGDGTRLETGRDHPSGGARSLAGSSPAPSAPARACGFDHLFDDWAAWSELAPLNGSPCVRSAHRSFRVPEVICLAYYDRLPGSAVTFSRRNVARRDHHTCQYCGAQPGAEAITIDHVTPRSQGGVSTWTNCVASCVGCNARKADRTPEQAGMKLRRYPVRPEWKPLYVAHGVRVESWARFLTHELALLHA